MEAREAAGDYPRLYLTQEFFQTIQNKRIYGQEGFPRNIEVGGHYDLTPDYHGKGFSVINGLRTTTDQPTEFTKTLSFFGGSTTFGTGVPDDLTFSSFFQRRLSSSRMKIKVINHGREGATVVDRVKWLTTATPVKSSDIIVLYFGANDCGWRIHGMNSSGYQVYYQPPLLQLLRRVPYHQVELLLWLYGEAAYRHNKWCANNAVNNTIQEIKKAKKWTNENGCKFLIVLQPHIYVSKTTSPYESKLRDRFSSFMQGQLRIGYPQYEKFVRDCGYGVSATTIFDNLNYSVYLDWAHVNARGNEIFAGYLFEKINECGWLD